MTIGGAVEAIAIALVLIAIGAYLYYLIPIGRTPKVREREYVHQYCTRCGRQMAIGWYVYRYDANTGKPSTYRWWVSCPNCGDIIDRFGGIVSEHEYINREYGVIPGADKPDNRFEEMPHPLHHSGAGEDLR